MKDSIAIIDLGSNSIRMNIIGIDENGGYSIYEQASEMVRLSEGMGEELILREAPIQRTIHALHYFRKLIQVNQVHRIYPLATAAVRMASNQVSFLKRIKEETDFEFKVLSGDEEAFYDYLGVVNSMEINDALIIDIGGGSTELIWMKDRGFHRAISLPFGSVTLTEKFRAIKSRKRRKEAAESFIKEQYGSVTWLDQLTGIPIIGLGGIIRTLGKVDRSKNGYPLENLHNYQMHEIEVQRICNEILEASPKDLEKISGISKKRVDIISVGLLPFKCLFEQLSAPEIRISGNGLREGFFFEQHFTSIGKKSLVEDVLSHAIDNFMSRFDVNTSHAYHVERLSMKLMEALSDWYEFDPKDYKLLRTASLLHDIGMHIEYYDHHIHGYYLIMNCRLNGLTNPERVSVAFLVGNHRASGVKNQLEEYEGIVDKKELQRLKRISVLLMICEQLDRAENGAVNDLKVTRFNDEVRVQLFSQEDLSLEITSAKQHASRFEKAYGNKIVFLYKL